MDQTKPTKQDMTKTSGSSQVSANNSSNTKASGGKVLTDQPDKTATSNKDDNWSITTAEATKTRTPDTTQQAMARRPSPLRDDKDLANTWQIVSRRAKPKAPRPTVTETTGPKETKPAGEKKRWKRLTKKQRLARKARVPEATKPLNSESATPKPGTGDQKATGPSGLQTGSAPTAEESADSLSAASLSDGDDAGALLAGLYIDEEEDELKARQNAVPFVE
ncbi:hypothetical protein RR48_03407 [Papilio machaon]|uniref:Uncharacterized protein n=1 Tax=Papilio machaon TaxID=76193 RepID=A0A0N1INN2_PAPMA|nr:hypothetical protein RR48_03407 [Papilio machaon]